MAQVRDIATALLIAALSLPCLWSARQASAADDPPDVARAQEAMRRATKFFTEHVATDGGYLYAYSDDLTRREGERSASATMAWVQPPGTPSVGMAFLRAYEATEDPVYLQAAQQAGAALVNGQLQSGGWTYEIQFDPELRKKVAYRVAPSGGKGDSSSRKIENVTVLDDNTTQAAIRLLMRLDQALNFKDATVHEAVQFALASLLAAQYPNGAWPQRYRQPPSAADHPVLAARYPDQWSKTWSKIDYTGYYTFNDDAISDVIKVMLEAAHVYDDSQYRRAAERGGDFILLAQMPDPQPAWAQQYNTRMEPAWARKFEPPAITGGESQGLLFTLMLLAAETGQRKYLEPVPRAVAYLRASQLPDGQLARFYELRTNHPLYFTRDYRLTESDADAPTHYTFKLGSKLNQVQREFDRLQKKGLKPPSRRVSAPKLTPELTAGAQQVIAALDDRGRWLQPGRLKFDPPDSPPGQILQTSTFIARMKTLSDFVQAGRAAQK